MTNRDRFLAACRCEPLHRPPVWLMRQAGRFLPEYRALKAQHDFLTLAHTPELAAEVTLQPIRRFGFDAAILFSDILVVPEALGQNFHFREGVGIEMEFVLRDIAQIRALAPERIGEHLAHTADALRLVRRELGTATALLGFAGSPWTLACYMVEGGGVARNGAPHLLALAREEPEAFALLMEKLSAAVAAFLRLQIANGADAVQIFDSWAALAAADYEALSLRWLRKVLAALPPETPTIVFAKGMTRHAPQIAAAGATVIGLDETTPLSATRQTLTAAGFPSVALQGNLDPALPDAPPETVRAATQALLADFAPHAGHIVNLGHGLRPTARIDSVEALVQTVRGE
jgi:uroporphyrinogen decarboxylase